MARQKAVTADLNSRDLMYRLDPAPKSGGPNAEKRYAAYLTNQRGESQAKVKVNFCGPPCGAVTSSSYRFLAFSQH